jgi:DNA (cytosine-5)-methyltransferase 1
VNELDIQQGNDGALRELALFAGAGGGILGGKLLGWRTVCAVERDAYAAQVLAQRQNDGILEAFPIWSDVQTFDGRPWKGIVDVISGGFPCQDISSAGKGAGIDGERSGLWAEFSRIIGEVRPRYAFIENSPMLTLRGLDRVICDLASLGYSAEWGVISASSLGAQHERERIWIVAHSNCISEGGLPIRKAKTISLSGFKSKIPNPASIRQSRSRKYERSIDIAQDRKREANRIINIRERTGGPWLTEPRLDRVAHGVANRMDRLKAIGNGQVPIVAATAFNLLPG